MQHKDVYQRVNMLNNFFYKKWHLIDCKLHVRHRNPSTRDAKHGKDVGNARRDERRTEERETTPWRKSD